MHQKQSPVRTAPQKSRMAERLLALYLEGHAASAYAQKELKRGI